MDRRDAIGLGLLGAAALAGNALAETALLDGTLPSDSKEIFNLWPGTPPGGQGIALTQKITEGSTTPELYHSRSVSGIQTPQVFIYRPAKPNGMALLVIPGGGYSSEGMERGGTEIARRFTASGITCFVLRYRLPGEGWANRADAPTPRRSRSRPIPATGMCARIRLPPSWRWRWTTTRCRRWRTAWRCSRRCTPPRCRWRCICSSRAATASAFAAPSANPAPPGPTFSSPGPRPRVTHQDKHSGRRRWTAAQ